MENVFKCNQCDEPLTSYSHLQCPSCGHTYNNIDGILICTDDPVLTMTSDKGYVGYDSVAKGYANNVYPKELSKKTAKAISETVGQGKTILNLGCGPGFLDIELSKLGNRVIAGDISINMLQILNSNIPDNIRFTLLPCRMNAYNYLSLTIRLM